jgi:hypothetical protein
MVSKGSRAPGARGAKNERPCVGRGALHKKAVRYLEVIILYVLRVRTRVMTSALCQFCQFSKQDNVIWSVIIYLNDFKVCIFLNNFELWRRSCSPGIMNDRPVHRARRGGGGGWERGCVKQPLFRLKCTEYIVLISGLHNTSARSVAGVRIDFLTVTDASYRD